MYLTEMKNYNENHKSADFLAIFQLFRIAYKRQDCLQKENFDRNEYKIL